MSVSCRVAEGELPRVRLKTISVLTCVFHPVSTRWTYMLETNRKEIDIPGSAPLKKERTRSCSTRASSDSLSSKSPVSSACPYLQALVILPVSSDCSFCTFTQRLSQPQSRRPPPCTNPGRDMPSTGTSRTSEGSSPSHGLEPNTFVACDSCGQ